MWISYFEDVPRNSAPSLYSRSGVSDYVKTNNGEFICILSLKKSAFQEGNLPLIWATWMPLSKANYAVKALVLHDHCLQKAGVLALAKE